MFVEGTRQFALLAGFAALTATQFTGCAGSVAPSLNATAADVGCVDDSQRCLAERKATLETIMNDKSRSWIARPASAGSYAAGVRLFAFMKLKRQLNCAQLTAGLSEAEGAGATLRAAKTSLTPAQISRGALLGEEVARDMRREMKRRGCKVPT